MSNSDKTTKEMTIAFIEEYKKRFNIKIEKPKEIKNARNIYKLETNKCYLYIIGSKEIDFWGFSKSMIWKLRETGLPYFLILLSNNGNSYYFPREIIQILCTKLKYDKGDNFKVNLDDLKDYDEYKLDWNTLDFSESISAMEETIGATEGFQGYTKDVIYNEECQNKKEKKSKEEIIKDKCQVIADIVNSLGGKYKPESKQADFLETVIGAAIFYIYNLNNYTWYKDKVIVSKEAYKQKEFCADHIIPRKHAASLLLKEKNLTGEGVRKFLEDKFCKLLYLTKSENARYRNKKDIEKMGINEIDALFDFEKLKEMYAKEGIILEIKTKEEFDKLKKQQR